MKVEQTVNEKSRQLFCELGPHILKRDGSQWYILSKSYDFYNSICTITNGAYASGHAYSAMLAYDILQENDGDFHLRIEDLDQSRAKIHWEEQTYEDLSWLGIKWNKTVLRQSERLDLYFTEMLKKAENFIFHMQMFSR